MNTDATTGRTENRNICVRTHSIKDATLLVPTYGNGSKHIKCNVHISRYLKGCYENTHNRWALKMRSFLYNLNEYRKELKNREYSEMSKKQLERYRKRYEEILEEGYEENKKIKTKFLRQDEQRLLNRLKKYKENHLMFLYDFSVPYDNNLAKKDLRQIKIKQKISGHFNRMDGMKISPFMYKN